MSKIKMSLIFICFLLSACAAKPLKSSLKKLMPEGFQNRVLVLGTPHLSGRKNFVPSHLDSLVKKLSDWGPTQICVESRQPKEIHKMVQLASFDKGVKKILNRFDGYKVNLSKIENKKLRYSFFKAYSLLQSELGKEKVDSFKVIQLSLVSYDFPNAFLYWSKLSSEQKKNIKISKQSKDKLNDWYKSTSEINTLAVRLAKEKEIKSLCSIDSQIDASKILGADEKEMETLFSSPVRAKFRDKPFFKELLQVQKKAFDGGDLLPAYVYLNSLKTSNEDETQWEWLFDDRTETGLNRVRFVSWDRRNSEIAKNIIEASHKRGKERILVVIGASHKSILERMLRATNSILVEDSFFK